jgi:excisionase family DNA binding protein
MIKTTFDLDALRELFREELGNSLKEIEISNQSGEPDEYLNVKQVSELIGLEESTIYALTSQRRIPHYKPSKKLLFSKHEILDWLKDYRCRTIDEMSDIQNSRKGGKNG